MEIFTSEFEIFASELESFASEFENFEFAELFDLPADDWGEWVGL
jgi:hypothetical protein